MTNRLNCYKVVCNIFYLILHDLFLSICPSICQIKRTSVDLFRHFPIHHYKSHLRKDTEKKGLKYAVKISKFNLFIDIFNKPKSEKKKKELKNIQQHSKWPRHRKHTICLLCIQTPKKNKAKYHVWINLLNIFQFFACLVNNLHILRKALWSARFWIRILWFW